MASKLFAFSDDGVVREMYDTLDPEEERKKDGMGWSG